MQSARATRETSLRRGCWCAMRVRTGRETAVAEALRRTLPPSVLADAFVPRKERWLRRGGAWSLQTVPMYPGYLVAVTKDAEAFARAAWKASFKVEPLVTWTASAAGSKRMPTLHTLFAAARASSTATSCS